MTVLVVFTVFVLVVMSSIGLFLSGISAWKQARLAKRMFKMRYQNEQRETSDASESNE